MRVTLRATLGKARIDLQVDIGFGDAVTPAAVEILLPVLLDFPAPVLRSYPRETVVAEKFQAMVDLGLANSRMKDFFDVAFLARNFEFDGQQVVDAVRATFERRQTALPEQPPIALTQAFAEDPTKTTQWRAFLRRSGLPSDGTLARVVEDIAGFLLPVLAAARTGGPWKATWAAAGPWVESRSESSKRGRS